MTEPTSRDQIAAEHELVSVSNNGGWLCECTDHRFVIPFKDPIFTDEALSVRGHQAHVDEVVAELGGAL